MRQIYEIGKNITSAMLALGVLVIALAILLAFVEDVGLSVAIMCAGAGVSLMLSSFALSLLVYLGEDVANIAARIAQHDVISDPLPGTATPKQTASGDDPNLLSLISKIEAKTQDKA